MSVGELILRMAGRPDPRRQLVDAAMGAGQAPQGAPAGAAPAPGTAGPAAQQQPPAPPAAATESPPDLARLYTQLVDRDRSTNSINTGIGLIGAAFAQPENRSNIINSMTGNAQDSSAIVGNLLALRSTMAQQEQQRIAQQETLAARQHLMGSLPAIAERLGIPLSEVRILADTGRLAQVLDEHNAPANYSMTTDAATGQQLAYDPRNPNNTVGVGGEKPTLPDTITDGAGTVHVVDPRDPLGTAQPFGAPKPPTDDRTTDMKNYDADMTDRQARGEPRISVQAWMDEDANRRRPTTTINNNVGGENTKGQNKADELFATEFVDWGPKGGSADVTKMLDQMAETTAALQGVVDDGGEGVLTGPIVGNVPDSLRVLTETGREAVSIRENVEEVVQRSLRAILGAQFTEKEGERLIARAFNPLLTEAENLQRVNRLVTQITAMRDAKNSASQYFQQHGTLTGWDGNWPSLSDIDLGDAADEANPERDAIDGAEAYDDNVDDLIRKYGGG